MMISPEILGMSNLWDRLLMHSVQGKDVQLRFVRETQATYESARSRLENGVSIRMKAVAAGTGLSMILAYDRLVNEGYDPARMTVPDTDRDRSSVDKTQRLLAKLSSTRNNVTTAETAGGISVGTEDLFVEPAASGTMEEAKYMSSRRSEFSTIFRASHARRRSKVSVCPNWRRLSSPNISPPGWVKSPRPMEC